jgi:hypothetical protein
MKISFHAWLAFGIVGLCPNLKAQGPGQAQDKSPPVPEERSADLDFENVPFDRKALEKARADEAMCMEGIQFEEESVTVSEPANRMLFQHEENVNGFLSIASKLGRGRAFIFIHLSNPRLATHGGVRDHRGELHAPWNENGHAYKLASLWGMIGDLNQPKPQAYLFRRSPKLKLDAEGAAIPNEGAEMEAVALNRFEEYALTQLQKGEKLVRWESAQSMHAVGAIRAEAQCLRCHDNHKAGDLLGAFTYQYTKSKAAPADNQTKLILTLSNEGKTIRQIAEARGLQKEANGMAAFLAENRIRTALLQQSIVTTEMLTDQARKRQNVLELDLGTLKKPRTAAGEKDASHEWHLVKSVRRGF